MIASQAQKNVSVFRENNVFFNTVQTKVEQESQNVLFHECVNDFKRNLFQKIQKKSLKGKTLVTYRVSLESLEKSRLRMFEDLKEHLEQGQKVLAKELKEYFEELGYTVVECKVDYGTFLVEKKEDRNEVEEDRNEVKTDLLVKSGVLVKIGEFENFNIMRNNVLELELCLSW